MSFYPAQPLDAPARLTPLPCSDGGDDPDGRNNDGMSALMFASFAGSRDVVAELLQRGASATATDSRFWTPLHFCASKGSLEVAQLLVAYGAELDAADNVRASPRA